jgi:hypothetical protein
MLHEFALDPEVISDWNTFRYFIDSFGVSHGRLISQFPKRWKRLVYDAVAKNKPTEIERKRIEERLNNIDDRLLKQSRIYDGEQNWINNAVTQHQTEPFHAIITTERRNEMESILIGNEIDENHQLWNVKTQKPIPRTANEMARAVSSLLKIAKEIIFIDPHFYPEAQRFRRPLERFIQEALHENHNVESIEYHIKLKVNFDSEVEKANFSYNFNSECQNKIAPLIPKDFSVKFIRWKERLGGKDFHARYILTDRGGVWIENGLDDDSDEGGKITPVVLMDSDWYSEVWNDFQKLADLTKCTYEYDDEITIIGTKNLEVPI